MILDIEIVKKQLRVDFDYDDDYIILLCDAAENHIANVMDHAIELDENGSPAPNITLAILLLVSHWYEHREAVSELNLTELPVGFYSVIYPDRNLGV